MQALTTLLFFIFGTIVGSFLNVVILRFNTGSTLGGRSHCFSCGKEIKWYDLVPLFSFIFLRGRCRFCKSKVSMQYPAVEFLTGAIFAFTFWQFSLFPQSYLIFSLELVMYSLLMVIAVYDLRHKIIPDLLVFTFGFLALVKLIFIVGFSSFATLPGFLDLLAGPMLGFPLFVLWLVSNGRWIGLGDAKLMLGIGWFLGLSYGVSAMMIGFWIGAAVSVLLLLIAKFSQGVFGRKILLSSGLKNLTIKSEVPLAPFLILGFLIVAFCKIDVLGLSALIATLN